MTLLLHGPASSSWFRLCLLPRKVPSLALSWGWPFLSTLTSSCFQKIFQQLSHSTHGPYFLTCKSGLNLSERRKHLKLPPSWAAPVTCKGSCSSEPLLPFHSLNHHTTKNVSGFWKFLNGWPFFSVTSNKDLFLTCHVPLTISSPLGLELEPHDRPWLSVRTVAELSSCLWDEECV